MVETIKLFSGTELKTRDNKSAAGPAADRKGKASESFDKEAQSTGSVLFQDESVSIIGAQIATSNMDAAQVGISNGQEADQVLQQIGDLIRSNPQMAEAAQANVLPQIVLELVGTL